ncbi:MAG: GxxExxY protein [Calditrichota bacterium]|jgi:GxxExxY protein
MEESELTKKIIGCAYNVYNQLGFGFLESVYEKSLLIELKKEGLKIKAQEPIKVYYEDMVVGDFVADIIVNNKVLVELKSVIKLNKAHEVQLVNYLTATKIDIGLLINFGEEKVEVKRKVREFKKVLNFIVGESCSSCQIGKEK